MRFLHSLWMPRHSTRPFPGNSDSSTSSREGVEKAKDMRMLGVDLSYLSLLQQHLAASPLESIFPTGMYPVSKGHPQCWTWWVAKSKGSFGR